jgi:hypothetical protein
MEGVMMSRNETSQRYREPGEGVSGRFGRASEEAADVLRDSSWNTIKGLQDYNEKLLEIAQTNVDATFQLLRQVAVAKSASEFITVATEHARRQYEISSEQAKELTVLAQRLAIASAEPAKEHATKMFDKAA